MKYPTILIATTNPGKLREVRHVLARLPVELLTLNEFQDLTEPIEGANTFEGNAIIKALHYARLTGHSALADDSGLEVDALGGRPGVLSARYAPSPQEADRAVRDAANNHKLLRELAEIPTALRSARFVCSVALAAGNEIMGTARGVVEGRIVDVPQGENGFGYDPHFFVPEIGLTTAQMTPGQKNRISHRGKAFRSIRRILERILADAGDR